MASQGTFCHVFLSFKGETRNKFTCFLYDALRAEGFEAFMDKEDIHTGDEIDSRIQDGIRDSMSAIIVFSKNYAFSTWCLDELLLILERKNTCRYFIIPVFYKVKPADIKHQLKNYGAALEKHKDRHNDKVEKWRQALEEVGNILGEHVKGMRNMFIQNLVKLFIEKFSANFPECRLPQGINQAVSYNELESRRWLSYKILQPKLQNEGDANNRKKENFAEDIAPTVEWLTTLSVVGTISKVIQPPCTPCEPPCTPCQPPCTPCQPPCTPCEPPCEPPCGPC